MKKLIIILSIIVFLAVIAFAAYELFPRLLHLLPTKSEPGTIAIVHYWGFPYNKIRISILQEEEQQSLILSDSVNSGEYQKFLLPELNNSPISFSCEIYNEDANKTIAGKFTLYIESGKEFTETGILIYLAQYESEAPYYIYFASDKNLICYNMEYDTMDAWKLTQNPPKMRSMPHKDPWFISRPTGWVPNSEWQELQEWQKDDVIDLFINHRDLFESIITLFNKNGWTDVWLTASEQNQDFYDKCYINYDIADNDELSILKKAAQWFFDKDIISIYYSGKNEDTCNFRFGWDTIGISMGKPVDSMHSEQIADDWYFYQAPEVSYSYCMHTTTSDGL